jgi:hypothetical protein
MERKVGQSGDNRRRAPKSESWPPTPLVPDVRQFAESQIYDRTDETIRLDPDAPARNLEQAKKPLHDSDINSGSQTFCWCGLRVWLGDPLDGIKASAC